MINVNELRKKVELGMACHKELSIINCNACPYKDDKDCGYGVMRDALKIADHYKRKYEQSMLATTPIILHDTSPIRIEPVDVKATLKAIKAMDRMERAAKDATEAVNLASEAILALKKELNEFDKK